MADEVEELSQHADRGDTVNAQIVTKRKMRLPKIQPIFVVIIVVVIMVVAGAVILNKDDGGNDDDKDDLRPWAEISGPDNGTVGDSLSWSAKDPQVPEDGGLIYSWELIDKKYTSLSTGEADKFSYTFTEMGKYDLYLNVTYQEHSSEAHLLIDITINETEDGWSMDLDSTTIPATMINPKTYTVTVMSASIDEKLEFYRIEIVRILNNSVVFTSKVNDLNSETTKVKFHEIPYASDDRMLNDGDFFTFTEEDFPDLQTGDVFIVTYLKTGDTAETAIH